MTNEVVKGESEQTPVAIGTHFGWVLLGQVLNIFRSLLSSVNLTATQVMRVDCQTPVVDAYQESVDKSMEQRVNDLYELEALGIIELDSVHETFIKDIKFKNNHHTVKLSWREYYDVLPDNVDLSAGRIISTLKRLQKDPSLLAEYDYIIQNQLNSGIIEEAKPSLENSKTMKVHYLSHQSVAREDALTTNVRVVMDGSAKVNAEAPSLNECLYTGPSLTPNILDILLTFRWFKVSIVSDIEKAFHMIRVDERDRDSLRFL